MKKRNKITVGIIIGMLFIAFSIMHPDLYPSTEYIKVIAFCTGVVFLTTSFMHIDIE